MVQMFHVSAKAKPLRLLRTVVIYVIIPRSCYLPTKVGNSLKKSLQNASKAVGKSLVNLFGCLHEQKGRYLHVGAVVCCME